MDLEAFIPERGLSQSELRQKVFELEDEIRKLPHVEFPERHYFAGGVYAREITIPAGSVLTGKIHKYAQINVLSKGEMTVTTEEGPKRVRAPYTIVSPPGTKRAAIAHEECVWTTFHGTNETDLAKIEAHFIAQDEQEYRAFCKVLEAENTKCLG
jgi:quercetin dioxygenase-like cupin family protein